MNAVAKTPVEFNFQPKTVKWVKFTIVDGIADRTKATQTDP
jgi:hypothetical protein